MAARLHLKIGVVAEQDRLSSSADSILVTEPATGSRARSKGSLYVVVTARGGGGRPREAAALVAETIRREYYYDESAGIPVCLDKAVRSANRRLRHQREGHGLAPGSIGASIAVIRVNELYVATIGDGDAYLVRQARLLMPEHQASSGLPAPDGMHIDVWRGEFAIGDSLILVSRNLTDVVGTEEIKNAVVTLHPQSAVEHLHHLFVAGSGEGSDAVLAIEATEIAASRAERRLVPVTPAEPLASMPERSSRDPFANAAHAVSGAGRRVQGAVGSAFGGLVDRFFDLLPQRRAKFKKVRPLVARRNSQRRVALALLMVLSFIFVAGVGAYLVAAFKPPADQASIPNATAVEQALADAEAKINRALGAGDVPIGDANQATRLLREAWQALDRAKAGGVAETRLTPLRTRAATGLDILYRTRRPAATPVVRFATVLPGADPRDLVLGPAQDANAAYLIDRASRTVVRIDLESGQATPIIKAGDGSGAGIGAPAHLGTGGPDVLVVDARGDLWRWRPSDDGGRGTLNLIRVGGDEPWGGDVVDIATFLVNADDGLYNLYVIDPSAAQIQRYAPTADGSGFSRPTGYLKAADAEAVKTFKGLLIDGDVYVLTTADVQRYVNGGKGDFRLADAPDQGDLRAGRELALVTATGPRATGRLFVWDQKHERIIVYSKGGAYQEQFVPRGSVPPFKDVRGIVVREGAEGEPSTLYWLTPTALYASPLVDTGPSLSPSRSPGSSAEPSGSASPSASGEATLEP